MRITERKCDCSHQMMPITEYTETSTLYYPTWEDSGVLTLIYRVNLNGSYTLVDFNLSLHVVDGKPQREVYDLPSLRDGWYKVKSYIFPTRDFLLSLGMEDGYNDMDYQLFWMRENEDNVLRKNHTMTLAISDQGLCYQGRIMNPSPYVSGANYYWLRADLVDVIDEFQSRGVEDGFVYGTNIRVVEEDFFSTCHLYKCFINRAQELLDSYKGCSSNGYGICNNNSSIKCKSDVDQTKIQIRDYLWMILKAIDYAIECEDYYTANNLLNCINSCSGICSESVDTDCGCGQYKPLTKATKLVAKLPQEAYYMQFPDVNDYYNKSEIIALLNTKQDKLSAGIDINITGNNIINNQHKFFSDVDITTLWNQND